ncbi:MAG: hypothetical protein LBM75_03390 [Myxococcales bacterium]|jgi:hypothetical protein|nr:hypothetical protein [Myxococcales bacterium]
MTILVASLRRFALLSALLALPLSIWGCSGKSAEEPTTPPLPRNIEQAKVNLPRPTPASQVQSPEPARPVITSPKIALSQVVGKALRQGDQIIAEHLSFEMQGAQTPSYKANIDYPYSDGAAQAISEEARQWVRQKMAAMGFSEADGKPTISWVIHVQPDAEERYLLETSLHSEGKQKFGKTFVVPAQFSSTRMNEVFSADFVPALP